ncbi:MAG: hypothetical protein KGO48_07785 [Alphaproteobacteria bacterium]|nr:hypothetical protein [Alphaproteobacteria bacterium]
MPFETNIDSVRFGLIINRLFARKAAAGAALGLLFAVSAPYVARAQDQYSPPPQEQYQYPPPQAQYPYPPPQAQYYPPPEYPVPPPGAMWIGEPGECLYANGVVYWCAPGVIFTGFPVGWNYARYPVVSVAPGIVLDPIWFGGWRREHPGFVFRGRIATDFERRAFFEHREEFRDRFRREGNPRERERDRERERKPEERR